MRAIRLNQLKWEPHIPKNQYAGAEPLTLTNEIQVQV